MRRSRWLDGRKDAPFFAWIHLYDAHSPYEPPEPLRSEFRAPRSGGSLRRGDCVCRSTGRPLPVVAAGRRPGSEDDPGHRRRSRRRRSAAMARARTATSSTTTSLHVPLIVATPVRGSPRRPRRRAGQPRRTSSRPCSRSPGSTSTARVHGRSLAPVDVPASRSRSTVYAYSESMAPEPAVWLERASLVCARLATSSFRRHGRSCTTSRRTLAKRPTSFAQHRAVARDMARELEHRDRRHQPRRAGAGGGQSRQGHRRAASLARLRGTPRLRRRNEAAADAERARRSQGQARVSSRRCSAPAS